MPLQSLHVVHENHNTRLQNLVSRVGSIVRTLHCETVTSGSAAVTKTAWRFLQGVLLATVLGPQAAETQQFRTFQKLELPSPISSTAINLVLTTKVLRSLSRTLSGLSLHRKLPRLYTDFLPTLRMWWLSALLPSRNIRIPHFLLRGAQPSEAPLHGISCRFSKSHTAMLFSFGVSSAVPLFGVREGLLGFTRTPSPLPTDPDQALHAHISVLVFKTPPKFHERGKKGKKKKKIVAAQHRTYIKTLILVNLTENVCLAKVGQSRWETWKVEPRKDFRWMSRSVSDASAFPEQSSASRSWMPTRRKSALQDAGMFPTRMRNMCCHFSKW